MAQVQSIKKQSSAQPVKKSIDLAKLFEQKVNPRFLASASLAYWSNLRRAKAKTKSRAEVSGGGRKPWRQKGTGRARAGSTRSPIWVGGGVAHGPDGNQDYSVKMSQKTRRAALSQALALKQSERAIKLVDSFPIKATKTKQMMDWLIKQDSRGSVGLMIKSPSLNFKRACRNIQGVNLVNPSEVNALTVLKLDALLADKDSLDVLIARLNSNLKVRQKSKKSE